MFGLSRFIFKIIIPHQSQISLTNASKKLHGAVHLTQTQGSMLKWKEHLELKVLWLIEKVSEEADDWEMETIQELTDSDNKNEEDFDKEWDFGEKIKIAKLVIEAKEPKLVTWER